MRLLSRLLGHRSPPTPTIPPGYVLVPTTPTLAMILAGHEAARSGVAAVYESMVKASGDSDGSGKAIR